jgi:prophage antirepressor-like protein
MSELQIFNFNTFPVRTIEIEGNILFIAKDVATALGYADAAQAIKDHCKKAVNYTNGDKTVVNEIKELHRTKALVIPESDVYRLVMRSKLERAEEFQDWVCEEVLPSIRKTGSYGFPEFLKPITEPITIEDFEWRYQVISDALKNLKNATVMMKFTGAELLAGKCFEK